MNPRFKFRIYDLEQNHYLRVIQDETTRAEGFAAFYGEYNNICKPMSFFLCHNIDRWVIEQCTGLKDKNGNLIYEGDIVSGRYFNPYHPKTPNPKIKGTIKFIQDRMTWIIEDGDCGYDLEDCMPTKEYFEIIGNIHEK